MRFLISLPCIGVLFVAAVFAWLVEERCRRLEELRDTLASDETVVWW